jgi:hypothetical protein
MNETNHHKAVADDSAALRALLLEWVQLDDAYMEPNHDREDRGDLDAREKRIANRARQLLGLPDRDYLGLDRDIHTAELMLDDLPAPGSIDVLRRRALELVDQRYADAASVATTDLDSVNTVRPPPMRYRSRNELVLEFVDKATAVATFAVNLELITPQQAEAAIKRFFEEHPELIDKEAESWIQGWLDRR